MVLLFYWCKSGLGSGELVSADEDCSRFNELVSNMEQDLEQKVLPRISSEGVCVDSRGEMWVIVYPRSQLS